MANLEQIDENNKLVMGWYGSCDNEPCSDFPLKTQDVYDVVESVYEISTDASKPRVFSSYLATENDSFVQSLESLECGHTYWFTLKSGVVNDPKSLTIDNLVVTGEQIADAGRVTDVCGGGGSIADVSFSTIPTLTGNNLEFSFSVDTTDLESACTSNIWKYRIKDSDGNVIKESSAFPTSTVDITETVPGGGDYVVEIWGLTSTGLMITTLKTETITVPWPASNFAVVGNINVNYLEWQGPSNADSVTFSDPQGWVDTVSFKKSLNIQNENNWRYKINNGQWQDVSNLQDGTPLDISDVVYFQLKEDLLGAIDHDDLTTLSRNWNSSVTVVYTEKNGNVREALVSLVGSVTNRIIGISNWTDLNDTDFNARVNVSKTALTRWQYKLEKLNDSQTSYTTPRILSDYSVIKSNNNHTLDLTTYISDESDAELGPGYYKIFVRGIHDTDDGIVVTPVLSGIAFCNWPNPIVNISDSVNVNYVEYEGPSADDFLKVATATYVHQLDFNTTNNETDWSYGVNAGTNTTPLPTNSPVDLSLADQINFKLNEDLKASSSPTTFGETSDKTYTADLKFNYIGKNTLHPDAVGTTNFRSKTLTGIVKERYISKSSDSVQENSTANTITLNIGIATKWVDKCTYDWDKAATTSLSNKPQTLSGTNANGTDSYVIDLNNVPSDYLTNDNDFNVSVIGYSNTSSSTTHENGWVAGQIAPEFQHTFTIDWPTTIFSVTQTISNNYVWQGVNATPANNGAPVTINLGWITQIQLTNAQGSDVSAWEYSLNNGATWTSLSGVNTSLQSVTTLKFRLKANLEVDDYGDATVDVVATDVQSEVRTKTINLNGSVSWPTPTFTVTPASTAKGYRETEGPSGYAMFQVKTKFIKTARWKTSGDVHWEYDEATNFATPSLIPTSDVPLPSPWADRPYQAGTPFSTQTTTTFYIRLKEGLEVPGADDNDMKPPLESASFDNALTFTGVDVAGNVITRNVSLNGTVTEYPNGCANYALSFATTGGEVNYDVQGVKLNGFQSGGYICVDNFTSYNPSGINVEVRDASNNVITTGTISTRDGWSANNVVYKAPDQQAYEATGFSFSQLGNIILTPMNL